MSFKPTGLLDWILLGYVGVVAVVALLLTPLIIGLGADGARSSPLQVVRIPHEMLSSTGSDFRVRKRYRSRARRRVRRFKSSSKVVSSSDPCRDAIERMITCTKDDKVRQLLRKKKEGFIEDCKKRSKDIRKAERCVKRSTCSAFERCLQ